MFHPVTITGAQATIAVVENSILHFGVPQSIIHDRRTAFLDTDFVNRSKELGNTLRPCTTHSFWTNGKVETPNHQIARYWEFFFQMMLALLGLLLRPTLRSPIILVLLTLLLKHNMNLFLMLNYKLLCMSNRDSILKILIFFRNLH